LNKREILGDLRSKGVVLLKGVFAVEVLLRLKHACSAQPKLNEPFSYSISVAELVDSAAWTHSEALAPLNAGGLAEILEESLSEAVECRLEQSFVRRRFAPRNAPRLYQPNAWHQDGGLGVAFGADPSAPLRMTRLVTCWAPLNACGRDRPSLEFVRRPMDRLLHYTQLDDTMLRERFAPEEFWAPEVQLGDGLVFLPGTLHRTFAQPEMEHDRLSIEYRLFPHATAVQS